MNPQRKKVLLGLLIGIALSLILYFAISRNALFALAIGCVAGVYVAQPISMLQGAIVGSSAAAPLGILNAFFLTPRLAPLASLEDLLLIVAYGALYGLVYVRLVKWMTRGQKPPA
ncbi:MAG TPA: hypothetical protein VGJ97_06430 [Anaerolineaceae bacterium]|jgi:hypothetical protein